MKADEAAEASNDDARLVDVRLRHSAGIHEAPHQQLLNALLKATSDSEAACKSADVWLMDAVA